MHFAHHTHTQSWEKDGKLVSEPYTLATYLLWMLGITYWRNRVCGTVRRSRGIIIGPCIRAEEEAKVVRESGIHMALYVFIAAGLVVM